MDLLTISEIFWPKGGGAELATYLILKNLAEIGFNITVLTGSPFAKQPHPSIKFIKTKRLEASSKTELWIKLFLQKETFKKVISKHDIVYIPRYSFPLLPLAKMLKKRVIVHLHDYIPVSYTAAIPAPFEMYENNKKSIDSFNIWLESKKGRIQKTVSIFGSKYTYMTKRWLMYADTIICVSKRHYEIIKQLAPQFEKKIEIIYNPLPLFKVNKTLGTSQSFLYIGGDNYAKGFQIFLRSTIEFLRKGYQAKFIVANKVSQENERVIQALNEKFLDAYEIKGKLPYNKLLSLYERSKSLIFPTLLEEPLPYAVIESILARLIPIASRAGGIPEIIPKKYAREILFNAGNSKELIEKIEFVHSLSKEETNNIVEELYEYLLNKIDEEKNKSLLKSIFT